MSSRVQAHGFIVDITLNLAREPEWAFHLNQGTANPIRVTGIENPLIFSAPIGSIEKRQIHEWLKSFNVAGLPHWTLYRDIVIKIAELKHEEIQLRKGHDEIEKFMAERNVKQ